MKGKVFMTRPCVRAPWLIAVALSLVCLICLARPAAAHSDNAPAQPRSSHTLTAAVHNYASYFSTVIGQIENGTAVTVLDTRGDFYKIDCYDMTGFIATSQVTQEENGKYYVNCQTGSEETLIMPYESMSDALLLRHSIMKLAEEQLGDPYVFGRALPGGFDCSGLTYYLYGEHGFTLDRRASTQLKNGIIIPKENMMIGDLVFFRVPGEPCEASHVGVYVGNNQIIHSGSKGVVYSDLSIDWFADNYLCARRVINTDAVQIADAPAPAQVGEGCNFVSASGRSAH